jgi:hypothetical protein
MEVARVVTSAWSPGDRLPLVVLLWELPRGSSSRGRHHLAQPQLFGYISAHSNLLVVSKVFLFELQLLVLRD